MIKAVFFDIDGTLISYNTHLVPESALLALKALREKGVKIFVATGRGPANLSYLHKVAPLEFDGYVTVNGQYCFCNGKVIREQPLPIESIECFLPYLEKIGSSCVFVESDYSYVNEITDRMIQQRTVLSNTVNYEPVDSIERIYSHKVYQMCCYIREDEEKEALQYLPNCRTVRWHPLFADIIPENGGKGVGINAMLKHFGISAEECMAFGDGGNDIELLKAAGIGIAMGNAGENLKSAADFVTDDVDDNGIYNALKKFNVI